MPNPTTLRFLNRERVFDLAAMDWQATDMPKLWCYNLHYFDFIADPSCTPDLAAALIDSWIADNPPGSVNAWEPYTLSKRIVNWCKYVLGHSASSPAPEGWLRSLHQQAAYLEGELEYHILANHFFENAVAMFFAGVCLQGPDAERWRGKALIILRRELGEQFLPDGGHYERSLLYHAILLESLLDMINLGQGAEGLLAEADLKRMRSVAERATAFLADLLYPDGEIPLFNDAAFGIAASPARLLGYADRVLQLPAQPLRGDWQAMRKPDSGYYGVRDGENMLLIDCGPLGPDYQPGHGHCDLLSYELCLAGRRLVVDSGVHDYELGDLRHYLRSTAAHNSLRVDGVDQSEIWHAFRVGRRARPLTATLSPLDEDTYLFQGAHDGYRRLPGRVTHCRDLRFSKNGRLEVEDRVGGSGRHRLESFLQIHPDFKVEQLGARELRISDADGTAARLEVGSLGELRIEEGVYCPEFGRRFDCARLCIALEAELPATIFYSIERV